MNLLHDIFISRIYAMKRKEKKKKKEGESEKKKPAGEAESMLTTQVRITEQSPSPSL